jgi:uncharacterized protein YegP (UPF0339 family)
MRETAHPAGHRGWSCRVSHRYTGWRSPNWPKWEGSISGKFVLEKGSSGKFHFNLRAANGQVIATSQHYESKESALKGIESVRRNAPGAAVEDNTGD